ncbi:MAG: hypothetical protein QF662_09155 [Phycisphaerae bacterium]|jgi:hypothetical protein|nr:hypothetical protein [Phycisphaerae bacterium]MDP6804615.1 hypothetical protein [Rhodospirillales bacterium]
MGEDHETSDNSRPGVEVFFFQPKTVKEMREFEAHLDGLAEFGFTYITDLRHGQRAGGAMPKRFRGVRLQYVPEFEAARSEEFRRQFKADPEYLDRVLEEREAQLVDLAERAGNMEGVRLSQQLDYETLVMRDGEFDAYAGGETGIRGQQVQMEQSLRDHVAAAVRHAEERR